MYGHCSAQHHPVLPRQPPPIFSLGWRSRGSRQIRPAGKRATAGALDSILRHRSVQEREDGERESKEEWLMTRGGRKREEIGEGGSAADGTGSLAGVGLRRRVRSPSCQIGKGDGTGIWGGGGGGTAGTGRGGPRQTSGRQQDFFIG
nr:uncharacterized protein LOC120973902 isoform X2 [Aegilops tauschii subsp. strangulata]